MSRWQETMQFEISIVHEFLTHLQY